MSGVTKLMTAGGGGVALTPASSIASDVTVNMPSVNGTLVSTGSTAQVSQAMLAAGVAGNGPAFSAAMNADQNVTMGVWTKVTFNTEQFDTNNNFDSTTNYRFTPTVAGYYQVNLTLNFGTSNQFQAAQAAIYKNGNNYCASLTYLSGNYYWGGAATVCVVIYCNGTTDYLEGYGYANGSSGYFAWGSPGLSKFSAALIRSA